MKPLTEWAKMKGRLPYMIKPLAPPKMKMRCLQEGKHIFLMMLIIAASPNREDAFFTDKQRFTLGKKQHDQHCMELF